MGGGAGVSGSSFEVSGPQVSADDKLGPEEDLRNFISKIWTQVE